jgi:hypothetical protein
MKRMTYFTLAGGLICTLIFTWIGPKTIMWWFQPPVALPIDCTNALHWAMGLLIKIQLVGLAVGMVSGIVLGFVFKRTKDEKENT